LIERNVDVLKTFGFDRAVVGKFMVCGMIAMASAACGRPPLDDAAGAGLAQVVLALDAAPADVSCVVITASTDHADRRAFSVTPGAATTFSLPRLPVGLVVFSVDAFAGACAGIGSASVATWLGGPISAVLHAGANGPIAIAMHRNGEVKVSVDFGDGGAGPVCAAEAAACVSDADCCMHRCAVDPAQASGVGICHAAVSPPPPPTGPSVDVEFVTGKSYLFYAIDGGPGCGAGSSSTYAVSVSGNSGPVCVSASAGDVVPVLVEQSSMCTPGQGCEPCNDDSCQPVSCFPPPPLAAAGEPCALTLKFPPGRDGKADYLLLRRIDVKHPPARPDGLPRLIASQADTRTVTITPPDDQPFAVTRLGVPVVDDMMSGDMCGGLGLCGIVPYQLFGGSLFGSWFFSGGNLFSSPLF
jgi:hypothetical protein